jgi:hypothetical protein
MLELTGMGSVLRAIGWLYWLLAIGAISFAFIKGKTLRVKALWTAIAIVVFGFLPAKAMVEQYQRDAYAKEAWAYFKKLCDEKSGEKIYKTYTGVKSVLVVKPLPPATEKDLYDQFWFGDPYSDSATPFRTTIASRFLRERPSPSGLTRGFEFVEIQIQSGKDIGYVRLTPLPTDPQRETSRVSIERSESQFGVRWEDISTPDDRKYWIAGSRFSIINLKDNSLIAERIGYFIEAGFGSTTGQRRPWQSSKGPRTTCPESHDWVDRWFVLKVLNPSEENRNGK